MELPLFEEVADAVRALAPADLGQVRCRARRWGIKVWFGPSTPPREHYEAQVISRDAVPGAALLGLEIGFHAEHPDAARNDEVLARLRTGEKGWRRELGSAAEIGPFLGRADAWRRVSETWPDPDLSSAELSFAVAARLTDYLLALEPLRRG